MGCEELAMSAKNDESGSRSLTWAEEVDADSRGSFNSNGSIREVKTESGTAAAAAAAAAMANSNRDISLEFMDGANEEKFKRLVKEEKLKTPFKRRYSHTPSTGSRSNSPNSSSAGSIDESGGRYYFKGRKEEKRPRHNSYTSSSSSSTTYIESDPAVLARRQKQIDYGKNTIAYERYVEMVPRSERTRDHPSTPNKYGKYSRRAFDGLVKIWRKQLHYFDPPNESKQDVNRKGGDDDSSDSSDSD